MGSGPIQGDLVAVWANLGVLMGSGSFQGDFDRCLGKLGHFRAFWVV